jgi:hypothetical protein
MCARLLSLFGVESNRLSGFGHCKSASTKGRMSKARAIRQPGPTLITWIYNAFTPQHLGVGEPGAVLKHQETRDSATRSELYLRCDETLYAPKHDQHYGTRLLSKYVPSGGRSWADQSPKDQYGSGYSYREITGRCSQCSVLGHARSKILVVSHSPNTPNARPHIKKLSLIIRVLWLLIHTTIGQ